jgi:hypothetical protein
MPSNIDISKRVDDETDEKPRRKSHGTRDARVGLVETQELLMAEWMQEQRKVNDLIATKG